MASLYFGAVFLRTGGENERSASLTIILQLTGIRRAVTRGTYRVHVKL